MVSLSDHKDLQKDLTPERIFTFINETGETRKIKATNVTDAWVSLSFREEAEVEVLVERGWRVKFR